MKHEEIVMGIVFDFAAFLTTRKGTLISGESHNASPMVEAVDEWATKRELSTRNANVLGWERFFLEDGKGLFPYPSEPDWSKYDDIIELRRAPGTCCPEPSCDHGWHGQLIAQGLDEAGMECEECGQKCCDCGRKERDCSACPDLKCEYSANLIWYCKHDPRHARCNEMLMPGGKGCKKSYGSP